MKKHLIRTFVFLSGIALFSSCMKNDPENNSTVYYGYQQIPNINEYMPQRLLKAMNDQHLLHFGDEPPKIEGCYLADSIYRFAVIKVPSSPWMVSASLMPGLKNYYKITDQHKGTAKMNFLEPHGSPGDYDYYNVNSENDSTYYYISRDESRFINDSIAPAYFKSSQYSVEDFRHVYIIGDAPYFTAYYYEIRDIKAHFLPLNAVIISGRVDKEITVLTDTVSHTTDTIEVPVIKDLAWGVETMMYYKDSQMLNLLIQSGKQPTPGDLTISKNLVPAKWVEQ